MAHNNSVHIVNDLKRYESQFNNVTVKQTVKVAIYPFTNEYITSSLATNGNSTITINGITLCGNRLV